MRNTQTKALTIFPLYIALNSVLSFPTQIPHAGIWLDVAEITLEFRFIKLWAGREISAIVNVYTGITHPTFTLYILCGYNFGSEIAICVVWCSLSKIWEKQKAIDYFFESNELCCWRNKFEWIKWTLLKIFGVSLVLPSMKSNLAINAYRNLQNAAVCCSVSVTDWTENVKPRC